MATPRKYWFKVQDRILREPISVEDRGVLVGLVAFANQRWARDGLTPEEACRVPLTPGDLHLVTGRERILAGLARLRQGLRTTSARVSQENGYVLVEWPKLAEIQGWVTREPGNPGEKIAPTRDRDRDRDRDRKEQKRSEPPTAEPSASSRLLNLLSKYPEGEDEKAAWLEANLDLIDAEVDKSLPDEATPKQRSGALRSTVIRWYRQYAKKPKTEREFYDWARKQKTRAACEAWEAEHGADYQAAEEADRLDREQKRAASQP